MSDQYLDLPIRRTVKINQPGNTHSDQFLSESIAKSNEEAEVSWWAYARAYDLMCEANPAYQDNLALARLWIGKTGLPSVPRICDLGAGTGNYLLELGKQFPHSHLQHIDWNSAMTDCAEEKYRKADLDVEIIRSSVDDVQLAENSLDAAICFNALYAFSERESIIEKVLRWLKPGGWFLVMDMGRQMDTHDWARYMVKNHVRQYGLYKTLTRLYRTRAAFPANRHVRAHQDSGIYWLHTTEAFKVWLEDRGFLIEHIQTCYRDVGDFAVCRKPA